MVTEEDIAHIVASWTGVPVQKLTESESAKLLQHGGRPSTSA
jgi:ATP-dependent Clp protease ATP-binding subunit ClpC